MYVRCNTYCIIRLISVPVYIDFIIDFKDSLWNRLVVQLEEPFIRGSIRSYGTHARSHARWGVEIDECPSTNQSPL